MVGAVARAYDDLRWLKLYKAFVVLMLLLLHANVLALLGGQRAGH
jgi:hypothetical protein